MFLAARGGAGGKGNAHFKCAENQTPQLAEVGGEGEEVRGEGAVKEGKMAA